MSHGKVLVRLFELRKEPSLFFMDHKFPFSDRLTDSLWLQRLAYLSDIFSRLNETNLSLQGRDVTVFTARDNILTASRKLQFWLSCVENSNVDCFPILNDLLVESYCVLHESVRVEIADYLRCLHTSLEKYFPPMKDDSSWVRNLFTVTEKPANFSNSEYENLIELISD